MQKKYIGLILSLTFMSLLGLASILLSNKQLLSKRFTYNSKASEISSTSITITVNPSQVTRQVNKEVFGVNILSYFLNHARWGENKNAQLDDYVESLRNIKASVLRIGGDAVYHWYDALGPIEKRTDACWINRKEKSVMSMSDQLTLAEKVGAQISFIVNIDTEEPPSARDFAEYANGELTDQIKQTAQQQRWTTNDWTHGESTGIGYQAGSMPRGYYAWLRSQPGYGEHEQPWKIKYWEIGNEVWAPLCFNSNPVESCNQTWCPTGAPSASQPGRKYNTTTRDNNQPGGVGLYIQRLSLFVDAIKEVDPTAKMGVTGQGYCQNCPWSTELYSNPIIRDKVDFFIDHPYLPGGERPPQQSELSYSQGIISGAYVERNYVQRTWEEKLALYPQNKKKFLANTEHGEWDTVHDIGTTYRSALLTVGRLNNFLQSRYVGYANFFHFYAPTMYNVWGNSPMIGPTGLVYELYGKYMYDSLINSAVSNNPTHNIEATSWALPATQNIPDLDVISSKSSDGKKVSVFILNRNVQRTDQVTLNIDSGSYNTLTKHALKSKYTGLKGLLAENIGGLTDEVYLSSVPLKHVNPVMLTLAPGSFTVLTFEQKEAASAPLYKIQLKKDFNGDGKEDILWTNKNTHQNGLWLMNGGLVDTMKLLETRPAEEKMVGLADFDNDGKTDILWMNQSTRQLSLWLMDGNTPLHKLPVDPPVVADWELAGTADFNNDGIVDLLWRNDKTGGNGIWIMDGTQYVSWIQMESLSPEWRVLSVKYFNKDSNPDILWRNTNTGAVLLWIMNGDQVTQKVNLGNIPIFWDMQGVGDFDGDSVQDMLWRNTETGENGIWYRHQSTEDKVFIESLAKDWSAAQIADFNNDGKADILWRNMTNGDNAVWLMDRNQIISKTPLADTPLEWEIPPKKDTVIIPSANVTATPLLSPTPTLTPTPTATPFPELLCEKLYSNATCETPLDCMRESGHATNVFCDTDKICCTH